MSEPETHASPLSAREGWLAACLCLLLGLCVVGRPVWDADWIYCATDTASVQAPWSATRAARNPQLSDSGVAFYPHYRLLARRWQSGEWPLWNPDLYVGIPLLANPQWGTLDPQVGLLVLFDALGGQRMFDWGFAFLALLRIATAALGTYLLARCLDLRPPAAALAGVGYALSGSVVLWLGFSLSHVTPCLPWVLLGIEGIRQRANPCLGWATTSLALALAIYGGHPEVAFFVALAAGVWSLSLLGEDPGRAVLALSALACGVLLAAPMLLPFLEYLGNSGALLAHQMTPSARHLPDFFGAGLVLCFVGFVVYWRPRVQRSSAAGSAAWVVAMALALVGLLLVVERRAAQMDLGLHELLSIEGGSARLALVVLALALGAGLGGTPHWPRGRLLVALAAGSWGLAVSFAPLVDLWRWLPLLGLAAPARSACCAALFVSLLAGRGLQNAGKLERLAAGLGLVLFSLIGAWSSRAEASVVTSLPLDAGGEVVHYTRLPTLDAEQTSTGLAGELHGGLRPDLVTLRFERLVEGDEVAGTSSFVRLAELGEENAQGVQSFDFGDLDLRALGPGLWRLRLEFEREGRVLGRRFPALAQIPRQGPWDWTILVCGALALLIACSPLVDSLRWLVVLLTLAAGWHQSRAWNPAVPRAEHLFTSQTERFLAREFAGQRCLAAPGILPADTALLEGLTTIDGYDALDVASFDGYRAYAMKPGRSPLLHWDAQGIDLESAAFRLFGVRALLLHTRRELEGWTLVAGPRDAPAQAEVFIYRADDPIPRAFCVNQLTTRRAALDPAQGFDPASAAFLEDSLSYELTRPFTSSRVALLSRSSEQLEFEVQLDGEGLFVSTEQHYPGWRLWVDGEPRPILRVNSIFRGALLEAGSHRLRFEYRPVSWQRGVRLGALACLLFLWGLIYTLRRHPRT